jgi:hypothetical protein
MARLTNWNGTITHIFYHSGRTDGGGGHRDFRNASGIGPYHFHHRLIPHLHNPSCSYEHLSTIEWQAYRDLATETEILVSTEKVFDFDTHKNMYVGAARLFGQKYWNIYALNGNNWDYIDQIPFDGLSGRGRVAIQPFIHLLIKYLSNPMFRQMMKNPYSSDPMGRMISKSLIDYVNIKIGSSNLTLGDLDYLLELTQTLFNYMGTAAGAARDDVIESVKYSLAEAAKHVIKYRNNFTGMYLTRLMQQLHIIGQMGITPAVNAVLNAQYNYNKEFSEAIMRAGFIHGQGLPPQNGLRMMVGNGDGHGCGPFSVYNSLFALKGGAELDDIPSAPAEVNELLANNRYALAEDPADIIRFVGRAGGFNVAGLAGSNPEVLADYLRRKGHNVKMSYLPQDLDEAIRSAGTAILLYSGGGSYIHYVMVRYANEMFYIYNYFWNSTEIETAYSMDEWVSRDESRYSPITLITF